MIYLVVIVLPVNKLKFKQTGRHFADISKVFFMYGNCCISIQMSLKFVARGLINGEKELVQIC